MKDDNFVFNCFQKNTPYVGPMRSLEHNMPLKMKASLLHYAFSEFMRMGFRKKKKKTNKHEDEQKCSI